jgi:methionyl-tRNA formyltransferase
VSKAKTKTRTTTSPRPRGPLEERPSAERSGSSPRLLLVAARTVGRRCLEALLDARAPIAGLLTLDPAKADATTSFADFDDLIAAHGLESRRFTALDTDEHLAWARAREPDLGLVVGVSQLVGEGLLKVPRLGFLGFHPTLLPKGRGRAPIPWALIKGLTRTGASIFWCERGADQGDLAAQVEVPIYYEDVSETLGARTDQASIRLLLELLPRLAKGELPRTHQDDSQATIWPRRRPEDGRIAWGQPRRALYDFVRALTHPYPGAFTHRSGRKLFVWAARESLDERRGQPGEVLSIAPHGALVACADGAVLLTRVQWEGEGEVAAARAGLAERDRLGE